VNAAVLYEPVTRARVADLDLDEPASREGHVQLVSAGVCHNDYHQLTANAA